MNSVDAIKEISLIIPVYNSEKNINHLLSELIDILIKNFDTYEIILVDDNSDDNSWQNIKSICKVNKFIKAVKLRKNVGQHNAIVAGLKYAEGKNIITMDDDGQNSPSFIIKLVEEINKGFDVVYANYKIKKHNFFRKFGSYINNIVASFLFKKPLKIILTSFRCFNSEIKHEILKCKSSSIYLDGIIFSITKNISSIEVEHKERLYGRSNYTFFKLFSLWTRMATGYSIMPLRLASVIGLFFSFTSFLITIWFVFIRDMPSSVPAGWTSLIVVTFFLGGLQLLALGLIGEYIGKTYLTINNNLQYSEKENINI